MRNEALLRTLLGDEVVERLLHEPASEVLLAGEAQWLEDLLRARTTLPLPEVPPILSQDLRDLFDPHLVPRQMVAVLSADSRSQRRLAGVRGAASQADGWSLAYTCEGADILLDIWEDQGSVDVDGQVLIHGGGTGAFHARVFGPASHVTNGDQLGRFRFTALMPGEYRLEVKNRRLEIAIDLDLAEAPA